MTWGTEPRLIIYHHLDRWWVYYKVNEGELGTNEYVFDTFEDVIRWTESVYWELEAERISKEDEETK